MRLDRWLLTPALPTALALSLFSGCVTTEPEPQARPDDLTVPIGTPIADRDVDPGRTYVKPLIIGIGEKSKADRLLNPGEGLAARNGAFRIVRPLNATQVAAVGEDAGFDAPLVRVRTPRLGEVQVGQMVFYSSANKDDFEAQRAAEWQEGKVDAVDPVFGLVKIGEARLDSTRQILVRSL